MSKIKLYNSE